MILYIKHEVFVSHSFLHSFIYKSVSLCLIVFTNRILLGKFWLYQDPLQPQFINLFRIFSNHVRKDGLFLLSKHVLAIQYNLEDKLFVSGCTNFDQ